jgi:hypothetical protein
MLLPHSKGGLDKSMRKSVYQSLDVLTGSQAFPHRNCFEAIPPDGIALCETLGNSNMGCVRWPKSILVDRASAGTSPVTRRLVQGVLNGNRFPSLLHPVGLVCVRVVSWLRYLSSIEFSVRIPQWTQAVLISQNGSHPNSGPCAMPPIDCVLCEVMA